MDDSFVAGAVDRDRGVRVASATGEVVFRAAEIANPFLAGGRDEFDGMLRAQSHAIDLAGECEHDGETTAIVVDARADESVALTADRQIGVARKDGVEVRADHDRRQLARAVATPDHVACVIGVYVREAAVTKATSDPSAAFVLFAGGRGDLRDGDLRTNDRVIVRGEPRVSGRERTVRERRVVEAWWRRASASFIWRG